jgi:hypothetical protein
MTVGDCLWFAPFLPGPLASFFPTVPDLHEWLLLTTSVTDNELCVLLKIGGDRKQNTILNGSPAVICISVATEIRVHRTVVQQWSIPRCRGNVCLPQQAVAPQWTFTPTSLFRLSDTFVVTGLCVAKRCPAMDYSGFQAPCHNMFLDRKREVRTILNLLKGRYVCIIFKGKSFLTQAISWKKTWGVERDFQHGDSGSHHALKIWSCKSRMMMCRYTSL